MESYKWLFFQYLCCVSAVYSIPAKTAYLVAEFNNQNVSASVLFYQTDDVIEISLENGRLPPGAANLSIHKFPVKYQGPMSEICKPESIGGIVPNFSHRFNIGSNISLFGQKSIFGRSLAIHDQSNNVIACATIKSKSPTKTVVGVFQAVSPGIAGTIVLRQAVDKPESDTAVDINLMLVDARSEPLTGLSLAVYKSASTGNDKGSCEGIEEIFNPLGKTSCDKQKHNTCPIGDLSAKLGLLDIPLPGKDEPHTLYIDTNLPLSGKNSVVGRALVILSNGHPLICAKIQEYQKMVSEVAFNGDQGLSGVIGFTQESMYEPVVVNVSLTGGYDRITVYEHVSQNLDIDCDINKLRSPLAVISDSGPVDDLTMYGAKSVVFGALTISKTSSQNMYCKQLKPKDPTYHLQAQVQFNQTSGHDLAGFINFEQVSFNQSKAFAYSSSILFSVWYKNDKGKMTKDHNWHIHISPVGIDPSGETCMSCEGHYNPYHVYQPDNDYESTCNPSNPFRCELGDLSSKLGTYNIGGGLKRFTETENYLASWHNIIGRSVVIHKKDKGAGRLVCADIKPFSSKYNMGTLNVKNTSKTRDKENFRKVVSEALNVQSWRVADMEFEQMKTDKDCVTYKFLLIDDSKSNLHQGFTDLAKDNPDKLKEFAPSCGSEPPKWKIDEGNSAEIIGVVFGIIILFLLVIVFVVWLRKRHKDYEESSKLVQNVDPGAVTSETAITVENNDNSPPSLTKDLKETTAL